MTRAFFLAGLLAFGTALPASADEMSAEEAAVLEALEAAIPGTLLHNPLDLTWDTRGGDLKVKAVDAPELTTGQALSARNKRRQEKSWDSVLNIDLSESVSKGDKIQVLYWLRTAKPAKGSESARVDVFVGRNVEPYDNILSEMVEPGAEWEMKSLTAVAESDFPAGEIKLEYQMGRAGQTVEIGPVYVSKLD